jgi:hypothetical protein
MLNQSDNVPLIPKQKCPSIVKAGGGNDRETTDGEKRNLFYIYSFISPCAVFAQMSQIRWAARPFENGKGEEVVQRFAFVFLYS